MKDYQLNEEVNMKERNHMILIQDARGEVVVYYKRFESYAQAMAHVVTAMVNDATWRDCSFRVIEMLSNVIPSNLSTPIDA